MAKFPRVNEIQWDKINEVRVVSDKGAFSSEFNIPGSSQKMRIKVSDGQTDFILCNEKGVPILHAVQKGKEIRILDFSARPVFTKVRRKLKDITPVRKR